MLKSLFKAISPNLIGCFYLFGLCAAALAMEQPAPQQPAPKNRATVLVSIQPLYLITRSLCKNTGLNVERLLDANQSPHHYALKISDRKKIQQAEVLFWLGPAIEPWLANALSLRQNGQSTLALLSSSDLTHESHSEHEDEHHHHNHQHGDHQHNGADPHIWLNPAEANELAQTITSNLQQRWPQLSEELENNLQDFVASNKKLQQEIGQILAPYKQQPFFVYHNAYNHFVEAFGLQQPAILYLQEGSSMSLKHAQALQAYSQKEERQPQATLCVFAEPQFKQQAVPAFIAEMKHTRLAELDPLGINADSYSDLIQNIANNMVSCFQQTDQRTH